MHNENNVHDLNKIIAIPSAHVQESHSGQLAKAEMTREHGTRGHAPLFCGRASGRGGRADGRGCGNATALQQFRQLAE